MSHKAERRPGPGEIWLAVTKHDGVQVDSIMGGVLNYYYRVAIVATQNSERDPRPGGLGRRRRTPP